VLIPYPQRALTHPLLNNLSRGVTAMKYRDGDEPVDMEILPGSDQEALPEGKFMVVVTENGTAFL
jgi:hypothetical protein